MFRIKRLIHVIFTMGLKAGIVGLPNVGKSTIFNALTESGIPAENYPFCTIDPNVGIVEIPDLRLKQISQFIKPVTIIHNTVEFVDIAGLVKGSSKGEGLGNQFLSHIRKVDAIIHVVRCFDDKNIAHVENRIDPIGDLEIIETELLLRDIESLEKKLNKVEKLSRIGDKIAIKESEILKNVINLANKGKQIRFINLDKTELEIIKPLSLLTLKPVLYVANVDENQIISNDTSKMLERLIYYASKNNSESLKLCGKLEMEISTMLKEDRYEFLEEYGMSEPGLDKLIHSAYKLLGLETFFTAGPNEVRAWAIPIGTLAPKAAGTIHSDFEKGFIKAEIYTFDDLIFFKSESGLKDAGKIRQEGKSYIVKDGDIIFFKFNI